jgi:DNA-directed RNA polymerase specialized sigma24 family protein
MVVEMKYFLGLTDEEAADALGMPQRTMQRMWRNARHWLFARTDRSSPRRDDTNEQSAG